VILPSVPAAIVGGTIAVAAYRICSDLGAGNGAVVPAGDGLGGTLVAVWANYGAAGANDLDILATTGEPFSGQSISYSGGSLANGQNFVLPANSGSSSGEYCITWLFEQSMIQPVRNVQFIPAGGQILGGGAPPTPGTLSMDDGRGAFHAVAGDAISYSCNMRVPPRAGSVWVVPFLLFSGDINNPGVTDPLPEAWSGGPVWVHAERLQKWLDDHCAVSAMCPPGTGAYLNPSNSWLALWLGLDLPGFMNLNVLSASLAFAEVSSGPQWAGPATLAYDSIADPTGLLGRNLANTASYVSQQGFSLAGVREHRTLLCGTQSGYTPIVHASGSATWLGLGVYGGGLAGKSLSIQCWALDPTANVILDTTHLAVVRFYSL
jgi:hypothetical protein